MIHHTQLLFLYTLLSYSLNFQTKNSKHKQVLENVGWFWGIWVTKFLYHYNHYPSSTGKIIFIVVKSFIKKDQPNYLIIIIKIDIEGAIKIKKLITITGESSFNNTSK